MLPKIRTMQKNNSSSNYLILCFICLQYSIVGFCKSHRLFVKKEMTLVRLRRTQRLIEVIAIDIFRKAALHTISVNYNITHIMRKIIRGKAMLVL